MSGTHLLRDRKLLIFDFDGTLADTSDLHAMAFNDVLRPKGIAVDYPRIAGRKTRDAIRQLLAEAGQSVPAEALDELAAAKQRRVRELISATLQPLPGVMDFLARVRRSHRLAIYSSGSRGTISLALAKLGFGAWFDPLLCAEDVQRAKPDPEGFQRVLALTDTPAARALVFEDSEAGIAAGTAAGIEVVDVRVRNFEYWAASWPETEAIAS